MKQFCFILTIICFLFLKPLSGQTNAALSQRLSSADLICEGTVSGVQSGWNHNHTMIYSQCQVEVHSRLSGSSSAVITFRYAGGKVGNEMIVSSVAPKINTGDECVFFFHNTNSGLEILPGNNGVIHIPADGSVCCDGSATYASAQELQQQLAELS
ncbi:MAG TPA: hypothetical protein VFJ43_05095, partial [Bacteroidia bacterium]|nr:hypothetical protein [Bacteroidia bacterium]